MNIRISEKCNGCGVCEAINSDVFEVDNTAHINKDKIRKNKEDCIDAAFLCPEGAISIDAV